MFVAPRYGTGSLADLFPSVLAGLGVPGEQDRLGLGLDVDRVCVLLVDGLGYEHLVANPAAAPFLSGLDPVRLTAGFPTTTATSLTSLGVGVPPGEHGIVGYLFHVPGYDRLFTPLSWRLHGVPKSDLRSELVPEEFQPRTTVFERAAADGIAVAQVSPRDQAGSGLTKAVLRGCEFRPQLSFGDLVAGVGDALRAGPRALVYTYHGDLDMTGHVRGPESRSWELELAHADRLAATLAEELPPGAALLVTADHGMVQLEDRIDFDTTPALQEGVRALGGEARARHVYTAPGAASDVAAAWQATLGPDFDVLGKDDIVARGWFGPTVDPAIAQRIGDLVVVARGRRGVIRTGAEPLQSWLIGHHGSLTAAEMNVPLCVYRA
ncbi:alkaline phosphatase family protein [Nocardia abscessus]|uniref:alkaline phosphatase family protein n=1 Tax=Nocardia TaxID=1817 RepID=UPI0015EE56A9|nr:MULTISPECIES: alkaline phosphatase family protein [Nocardia]MBF6220658.1 alkaline phosphatase family protein [Nocardia abscessus]MDE1671939.1 alkaline phosphatase family protein [Nocardia gipuzkoensis]